MLTLLHMPPEIRDLLLVRGRNSDVDTNHILFFSTTRSLLLKDLEVLLQFLIPFLTQGKLLFLMYPFVNLSKGKNSWWLWSLPYSSETHTYIYGLKKGTKNRKAHFVSDQNCSDLVREEHLVHDAIKEKLYANSLLWSHFRDQKRTNMQFPIPGTYIWSFV